MGSVFIEIFIQWGSVLDFITLLKNMLTWASCLGQTDSRRPRWAEASPVKHKRYRIEAHKSHTFLKTQRAFYGRFKEDDIVSTHLIS